MKRWKMAKWRLLKEIGIYGICIALRRRKIYKKIENGKPYGAREEALYQLRLSAARMECGSHKYDEAVWNYLSAMKLLKRGIRAGRRENIPIYIKVWKEYMGIPKYYRWFKDDYLDMYDEDAWD